MASLRKSLVVGFAVAFGWFLGNVVLRDATVESALTGEGIALTGAGLAFVVAFVAAFLFR